MGLGAWHLGWARWFILYSSSRPRIPWGASWNVLLGSTWPQISWKNISSTQKLNGRGHNNKKKTTLHDIMLSDVASIGYCGNKLLRYNGARDCICSPNWACVIHVLFCHTFINRRNMAYMLGSCACMQGSSWSGRCLDHWINIEVLIVTSMTGVSCVRQT